MGHPEVVAYENLTPTAAMVTHCTDNPMTDTESPAVDRVVKINEAHRTRKRYLPPETGRSRMHFHRGRVSLLVGSAVVLLVMSIGAGAAFAGTGKVSPRRFFPGTTITKVKFKKAGPTVTVSGHGLPVLVDGQSVPAGCDNGETPTGANYADFNFVDNRGQWAAGSTTNNGFGATCIGIVPSESTSTHIVFTFGSALGTNGWSLCGGDSYTVEIESTSKSGTVKGLPNCGA
jgi:hypothetical protein